MVTGLSNRRDDGLAAWLRTTFEAHVYLYSLCFAIFNPLFGYTVLAVEPLNLFYYLVALTLILRVTHHQPILSDA